MRKTGKPSPAVFYNVCMEVLAMRGIRSPSCNLVLAEHLDTSKQSTEPVESIKPADMLSREVTNALATISRSTTEEEFALSLMPIETDHVKQGSLLAAASGPIDRKAFKGFIGSVWKELYQFPQSNVSGELESFRTRIFKMAVDHTIKQLKQIGRAHV